LCNNGISRKNLYKNYEEEKVTDTMVTKDLHVRVAETCVNQEAKTERIKKSGGITKPEGMK